jgi:hypothetical protein
VAAAIVTFWKRKRDVPAAVEAPAAAGSQPSRRSKSQRKVKAS